MSMTMHDQLVGVFSEMLANLDKVLTKAETDCETRTRFAATEAQQREGR